MRTKVLLCAAAVAALGAFSTMAQNVYSLNVVGYVNIPLVEGWNMVANPLDVDSQGTNNTVTTMLGTNMPVGTTVYTFDPSIVDYKTTTFQKSKTWSVDIKLNPGLGAWVNIPAGAFGGVTQNVTVVGNVLQGNLANPNIPAPGGFCLIGSQVPISGGITTTLNYQPAIGDTIYTWDPSLNSGAGDYVISTFQKSKVWSAPGEPQIKVGQGFWLNAVTAGQTWTTNFQVPQN